LAIIKKRAIYSQTSRVLRKIDFATGILFQETETGLFLIVP
jgi:hypothetical protein